MTLTVTLQVNQPRLIGNLKHAFSNQSTFLSELMQNARRAGATEVRFEFHAPNTLVVFDNGHGIDNLQNLLTIAESGWDDTVCSEERPFGMGFMSALFAANKIEVSSHYKCLRFEREDAIQQLPIQIESCDFQQGTCIALEGISLSHGSLKSSVKAYARGFSIPVYFDDELCLCEHSWNNLISQPQHPSFEAFAEVSGIVKVAFDVSCLDCSVTKATASFSNSVLNGGQGIAVSIGHLISRLATLTKCPATLDHYTAVQLVWFARNT